MRWRKIWFGCLRKYQKNSAISVQRKVALFVVILGQIILDADYLLVERNWARIVLNKRALNHRGRLPRICLYIFFSVWQSRELIDQLFTIPTIFARALGLMANITWYFRGKKNDKICPCEKSRSTLFILSKRHNDRFSHAKCILWVSIKLTSLLITTMTSSVAIP